jgi:outer membrane protein assembly factor BamB
MFMFLPQSHQRGTRAGGEALIMTTRILLAAVILVACSSPVSRAADWPQYRADAARTGYTTEKLPARLQLEWTYKPLHAPHISWPNEPRALYDHAYQVVVSGGTLVFGSSADCGVHALDAASGAKKWSFFTGGPVRCAPAISKDRVFAASDDGFLYCLSLKDGKLLWKKRAGPSNAKVIGSGRSISKWPARGGPAVVDDVVYFAAGVWPADGTYVYALEAASGKQVWCNSTTGALRRGHPHAGGFKDESGIGFQGHIAVGKDVVLVPTGRSLSAAFDRKTGKLRYFRVMAGGGTSVSIVDDLVFDGGYVFNASDGKYLSRGISPRTMAASPEWIVSSTSRTVTAMDRKAPYVQKRNQKRKRTDTVANVKWTAGNAKAGGGALIIAGRTVYTAGGKKVVALDGPARKITWSANVDAKPWGLAVAGGRLYVSTAKGSIYCFGASGGGRVIEEKPSAAASGGGFAAAAAEILKKSGIREGHCVDLGCGSGELALELARGSKLLVHGIEQDPVKVAAARKRIAAAGLYGTRVIIHQADPARSGLPKWFANLVVSGNSVTGGAVPRKEAERLQRPWGGVICLGKAGAMKKSVRGALSGAGQWTHQYASPAGTSCSGDKLVRGPLTVQWFGGPDMDMPNRHGRAPAPLFFEGQLLIMGMNKLRARDAYNGRVTWEVPFKDIGKPYDGEHLLGTAGTGSTYCVAPEGVFVRHGAKCYRLDRTSGKQLGEFALPGGVAGEWGFVASEAGILFGSRADTAHRVPYYYGKADMSRVFIESRSFFAMNATSGKLLWKFKPKRSVRNNSIVIGNGRVYLIDREKAEEQPRYKKLAKPHKPGELICLDAKTGHEKWRKGEGGWATLLALSTEHDVLLLSGQPAFKGFGLTSDQSSRIVALKASTGAKLWEVKGRHAHRPVINGKTVYLSRGKIDLLSGKLEDLRIHRYHGCGPLVAGANMLLFRSAVLGYIDLKDSRKTQHFGGIRPGCWITAIPAGGMVLMPEFSEKCGCAYLNKTTISLTRREP